MAHQFVLDGRVFDAPRKESRYLKNAMFARRQAHFWREQARNIHAVMDVKFCIKSFHLWMGSARHCVKLARSTANG